MPQRSEYRNTHGTNIERRNPMHKERMKIFLGRQILERWDVVSERDKSYFYEH